MNYGPFVPNMHVNCTFLQMVQIFAPEPFFFNFCSFAAAKLEQGGGMPCCACQPISRVNVPYTPALTFYPDPMSYWGSGQPFTLNLTASVTVVPEPRVWSSGSIELMAAYGSGSEPSYFELCVSKGMEVWMILQAPDWME